MLSAYINETQNLLNDSQTQFFSQATLTNYINRARRRIAYQSGCLRCIPPGLQTVPGQEQYPLAQWNSLIQEVVPGAQSAISCRSIAIGVGGRWIKEPSGEWRVAFGSWKPMWRRKVFTDFQATLRIYGGSFMGTFSSPGWYCVYGVGPNAKILLAPIPTMAMPMEVDLDLIPFPLLTDDDQDCIPYPYQDAVAYWAAIMCLMQMQRGQDAQNLVQLYNADLPMCASVVQPTLVTNPYGATLRSA